MRRWLSFHASCVLLFALPSVAHAADEKSECVEAADRGQDARAAGHMKEARTNFLMCAADACPSVIRKDCSVWLKDVDDNIPSFVPIASRADGSDVADVRLFVDGVELLQKLDGKAIAIDPGMHDFRFEADGGASKTEMKVLLAQGEKNRRIVAKFDGGQKPQLDEVATYGRERKPIPAAAYVLAGVGVLGLSSFAYFGFSGLNEKGKLDDSKCAPACNQSDIDSIRTKFIVADVSLGVSIAALTASAVVTLTRGYKDPSPTGSRIPFYFAVTPAGGSVGFASSF